MRLRAMKIIEALDAQAATSGQSRAEVVRQALEFALGLKR
jgi:hypothetical protein